MQGLGIQINPTFYAGAGGGGGHNLLFCRVGDSDISYFNRCASPPRFSAAMRRGILPQRVPGTAMGDTLPN